MNNYDFHHLDHVKEQNTSKKTLWITLLLTLFFTIVEIVGGLVSNSLALLSDSAHMISDVLALGLSMAAIYMATRKPNRKYTFGFLRFEIIASFLNGLALAVIAVGIFAEGIKRIIQPQAVDMPLMLTIASVGLAVNVVLTIVLSRSTKKEDNLNVKSALWHFVGDLLSSVGIIVSAILIHFTGLLILDPLISMVVGGIIFLGGFKIIRESYLVLMETVPEQFDLDAIRAEINGLDIVADVHELHLWAVTTEHYSLTAHVFVKKEVEPFCAISAINDLLKNKYGIEHSTLQIEHPILHDHGDYGRAFMLKQA
ncbi:cation diffusion facilitator family transporter [Cohnella ginsengisoli]|uniref:Cation diffusion facilitator family transporter n=1 Tax=Cohnella ginsengisoli TaxID=425004 RepID=A0A9X4KG04_9BACL|nr:cation diffusion facilitator family transporter [Cohnella ginsengisoli]MDG0791275.1 cation diffusion facilitator family transporter [Cohnella ginsengisoli]